MWVEGGGGGAGNELGEGVREVKEREEQEKGKDRNGAGNRASLREGRREGGGG